MKFKKILFLAFSLTLFHCAGEKTKEQKNNNVWNPPPLNSWIQTQLTQAKKDLLANIHPADTSPGVIVASPSRKDPNYFYYWVRDGALVMNVIVNDYENAKDVGSAKNNFDLLSQYITFSKKNQVTPNPSTALNSQLGEPKFNVDGSPFTGSWGRPQNDGPALRMTTLTHFAWALIKNGKKDFVRSDLYGADNSVIKADADYVAAHWQEPSYDLWEEVSGSHFYTKMVQRTGLIKVAALAKSLGDEKSASRYLKEAKLIEKSLLRHWNKKENFITVTVDYHAGLEYKKSGLDTAIILAAIHTNNEDGFFAAYDDRILATAAKLRNSLKALYKINQLEKDRDGLTIEAALGRYPEDKYNGLGDATSDSQGNPWILNTLALQELISKAVHHWQSAGSITVNKTNLVFFKTFAPGVPVQPGEVISSSDKLSKVIAALNESADSILRRVRYHSVADGSLDEEWNRDSGLPQGAKKLTWSSAAFITATTAR